MEASLGQGHQDERQVPFLGLAVLVSVTLVSAICLSSDIVTSG